MVMKCVVQRLLRKTLHNRVQDVMYLSPRNGISISVELEHTIIMMHVVVQQTEYGIINAILPCRKLFIGTCMPWWTWDVYCLQNRIWERMLTA